MVMRGHRETSMVHELNRYADSQSSSNCVLQISSEAHCCLNLLPLFLSICFVLPILIVMCCNYVLAFNEKCFCCCLLFITYECLFEAFVVEH